MVVKIYPEDVLDKLEDDNFGNNNYKLTRGIDTIKLKYANYYIIKIKFNNDFEPSINLFHKRTDEWKDPYRIVSGFESKEGFYNFLEKAIENSSLSLDDKEV